MPGRPAPAVFGGYTAGMVELNAIETRVLGVLIEKAHTVPGQYPLTLNATVSGANQKNNRHPVTSYGENEVLAALDGLRNKSLVREAMLSGSRVPKYRHVARETLDIDTRQLAVLAELMLRGPQTVGELRSRASRMTAIDSTETVHSILESLMQRDSPLARQVPPAPGSRAPRFVQLLCPDLHAIETEGKAGAESAAAPASAPPAGPAGTDADLLQRIEHLEQRIARLEQAIAADHSNGNG